MKTTLNEIKAARFQKTLLDKLLKHLGKVEPDDEPLPLLTILDAVGFEHTLWCFRAVDGFEKEKQLLAITFARGVEHLMPAESKKALEVFERYANGLATQEEFETAREAARSAAAAAYGARAACAAADADAADAYATASAATAVCAAGAVCAVAADADAVAAAGAYALVGAPSTIKAKQEAQLRRLLESTCTQL